MSELCPTLPVGRYGGITEAHVNLSRRALRELEVIMYRPVRRRLVPILIGGTTILVLAILFIDLRGNAEAATIDQAYAVGLAIRYAQTPMPGGWLTSTPTQAHGKLTTLGDAWQTQKGYRLTSGSRLGRATSELVWLVALRGNVMVVEESSPNRPPTEPVPYRQISVILNATTGELITTRVHAPVSEIATGVLPIVDVSVTPASIPPTPVRAPTTPYPMKPGAPNVSPQPASWPTSPPAIGVPGATATPTR